MWFDGNKANRGRLPNIIGTPHGAAKTPAQRGDQKRRAREQISEEVRWVGNDSRVHDLTIGAFILHPRPTPSHRIWFTVECGYEMVGQMVLATATQRGIYRRAELLLHFRWE